MKIQITLDLYDENADPDHESGVKPLVWDQIYDRLTGFGDDMEILKVGDD